MVALATHLDSPTLMMYIMKRGVLLTQPLQRVPRHTIAAVVIDAFHDGNGGKADDLTGGKTREHQREGSADCIEDERLGEGVVKGAEGVGDIDTVVVGMDITCEERGPKSAGKQRKLSV